MYYEEVAPEGRVSGPFSRLAKGGIIHGEDDEVFMPEVWVRRLGVDQGDWLAADPLWMLNNSMLYEFTVLERHQSNSDSHRVSIIGPLVYHAGEWLIFHREEDLAIPLNTKEVRSLRLKEGDLVEVAYMEGDMSNARIAWILDQESLDDYINTPQKKHKEKRTPTVDIADPILSGRTVLVVGADLYKEAFHQMFQRRGALFQWESGFQGGVGRNIESKVRNSDITVIVTEMMSHRIPDVELMCKKHHRPFVYAPSKGSTGAIREVQKKLSGTNKNNNNH